MNRIILNYILKNFLETLIIVLFFYCFGVILNLFEEVEFLKNLDVNILAPLIKHKRICSEYDFKDIAIYYFYFKYVVYDENQK